MKRVVSVIAVGVLMLAGAPRAQQTAPAAPALVATNHPQLPRDLSQLWLVPDGRAGRPAAADTIHEAIRLEAEGSFTKALAVLSQPAAGQGPLQHYAQYYKGIAELRLSKIDEARRTFRDLQTRTLSGYLTEAAALREAETHEARGDQLTALDVYERLSKTRTLAPDEILMRIGHSARLAGLGDKAKDAYARIYYDDPLSDLAVAAGGELESGPIAAGTVRYVRGLERAERLFVAKRYPQARIDFETLRNAAQGDDRELVNLRLAECDFYLKRWRNARTALRPYIDRASRQGEALFFHAAASRELKDESEYLKSLRRVIDEFPAQSWAEAALNDVGNYYVVHDQDDKADEVFRELTTRFPAGRFGERAAWKIGWWAYKNGRFLDAARAFDRGSADYPRSDYRPMWLYWSGRAYDEAKDAALASARYTLTVTDYANTYHGRLALKRLADLGQRPPERRLVVDTRTPAGATPSPADVKPLDSARDRPAPLTVPPNASEVRALLSAGLYEQAVEELRYAQKVWGTSSVIDATLAWTSMQRAHDATGAEQFNLLRGAMNAMKRAYPQYLAAGGEDLPSDLQRIIFPVKYWDLIRKYAAVYNLDPYIAAALIAQESTFVPDIKSYANAVGLTQLMAPTARQYARVLKLAYSPKMLTNPEYNLQVGMKYFAQKIKEFGEVYLALASYNAGERPVHRWVTERPGVPSDEFIDDIPYPQTQGYVKKIMGTAEDYRRLYGPDAPNPEMSVADSKPADAKATTGASQTKKKPARRAPAPTRKKKTRK